MKDIQLVKTQYDGGGRQNPSASSLEGLKQIEDKIQELEDLRIVWDTCFPFELMKDEYIQLDYDNNGDKCFSNSVHVRTFEELLEFVKNNNGKCNIAISPNTRKPINGLNRRTGKEAILRQRAILIDVEDKANHGLTDPDVVRGRIIDEVLKSMPEDIRKAVRWVAYTGGGGLICIVLDKVISADKITIVYDYLKEKLKGIKYIDENSFKPSQAMRLIGTLNVKYGKPVQAFIYKGVNDNYNNHEDLKENEITETEIEKEAHNAKQEIELKNATEIRKHRGYIENLDSAIKEIKEKVRVADVFKDWDGREGKRYTSYRCPFHGWDTHPSFAVYHHPDCDLAIDFHNIGKERYYDVIGLYMKVYKKSFIEAIEELAEIGGIQLVYRKNKKEAEKMEALSSFDADEYVENELRIKKVDYWRDDEGYHYEITVENKDGEYSSFVIARDELVNHKTALKKFDKYICIAPKKLPKGAEEDVWDKVVEVINGKSERVYMGDTVEEKLDVIKQEINAGRITTNFNDFLSTSLNLKFEKDGKTYIQLTKLLNKLKARHKVFNDLTQKELQQLLRKMGAEPIQYGHKRIRLWLLPKESENGANGMRTAEEDLTVRSQTVDNQGEEENANGENGTFSKIENDGINGDDVMNEEKEKSENVVFNRSHDEINIDRQGESMRTAGDDSGARNRSHDDISIDREGEDMRAAENNEEDDEYFYPETF